MATPQQHVPIYPQGGPREDTAQPVKRKMPEIATMREAQDSWVRSDWAQRRKILRAFRAHMAARAEHIAGLMPSTLARNHAETLGAEILPLLDACKFLELEAEEVLRPERLGTHRLPLWLRGVHSEVYRDPLGIILVIAPSNYPLFLAGVQALQALVAGNACIWKPAPGCEGVAHAMRHCLLDAGLPPGLLWVTETSIEVAMELLSAEVDKVFVTGSVPTGQSVLRQLANSVTPAVMELSGCDAVIVLPGADLAMVSQALAFGSRLNGSATCMAPRRVLVPRTMASDLESQLKLALRDIPAVAIDARTRTLLHRLVEDAQLQGARLVLDGRDAHPHLAPVVLANVDPAMLAAKTDIFAPLLALMPFDDEEGALCMYAACPFALSVAIFGPERHGRALAHRLVAGTVILNDVIAPTVDPRISFGGRRTSGYGVTRGREGLLEMTAPKVMISRRGKYRFHYEKAGTDHRALFTGMIHGAHGEGWLTRVSGWMGVLCATMRMSNRRKDIRPSSDES